jgi:hypothetical protein
LQVCVDRYTAFRNYVLALKDSGAANVSLAAAAADFTKQQKRYARAAARGGGLGALAAAAAPAAVTAAGSAGVGLNREQQQADGWVRELGAVDNSYAALIQQTKQRMQQKREQQQQQESEQKPQQEQGDEQHLQQQQQQQNGYREPLKPQQPSQEQQQQQQPDVLDTEQQQERQNSGAEQNRAVQAQAVCGVQRQGSGGQAAVAAVAAGKQVMLQPCSKVAELQQQVLEQQQTHAGVVVVPESDEEF